MVCERFREKQVLLFDSFVYQYFFVYCKYLESFGLFNLEIFRNYTQILSLQIRLISNSILIDLITLFWYILNFLVTHASSGCGNSGIVSLTLYYFTARFLPVIGTYKVGLPGGTAIPHFAVSKSRAFVGLKKVIEKNYNLVLIQWIVIQHLLKFWLFSGLWIKFLKIKHKGYTKNNF